MGLDDKRFTQYVEFKTGSTIEAAEQRWQLQTQEQNHRKPAKAPQRKKSGNLLWKFLKAVKNGICFSGCWVWFIIPAFRFSPETTFWLCVLIPSFISIGNLNLYLAGKRSFGFFDAFNVLNMTDSTWQFEEQRKKNPPLIPELILKGGGVFIGSKEGKDVGKNMNQDLHCIVFGGSGSGKSSCIAIPTLNRYTGGVFAIDIKDGGELQRKSKSTAITHVFRPGDRNSAGYNPFWFVDKKNPTASIKEIAYALIPTNPKEPNDFWTLNEQRYLMAALYYCYFLGQSFAEACRTIYGLPSKELLEQIQKSECSFAKEGMADFGDMADETLGGIIGGVNNAVATFATDKDILDALTEPNIITPELLLKGERIFICIPEHKLDVYKELLQLIISQFLRYFEQLTDAQTAPVLFMLDEFARLGRYDKLINGLATLRSKKVTIMILTQSISQLDAIYGKDNRKVMLDNCGYKVVLNASDADSQQYFSKIVGTYVRHQRSYSRGRSSSTSISERELPIIKPEDFATLKEAVLCTPYGFFRIKKQPYYKKQRKFKRI